MAKRQISKPSGGVIRDPGPTKGIEREFQQAMRAMVDLMSRQWRNQVLGQLQQRTVEKFADSPVTDDNDVISFPLPVYESRERRYTVTTFADSAGLEYNEDEIRRYEYEGDLEFVDSLTARREERAHSYKVRVGTQWRDMRIREVLQAFRFRDAQTGNYAAVLLKLNRAAQRKLLKRFDDKRLERLARETLSKVNRRNAQMFYKNVEDAIGINARELLASEGLQSQINALILETAQWAKKLRDETLEIYVANTLRAMAEGQSLSDILDQFNDMEEKRKNHAQMVARTQVATFNSLVGKARAQNLGITRAVWVTSRDERVRECHRVRDGKEFELSEGLYSSCDGKTLLPGVDYNCRCTARYIIPEED